jgi:hypothetical protein
VSLARKDRWLHMMMQAARTSETSVDIQLRTRKYIPEDSELHTRRRENLKSHTEPLRFAMDRRISKSSNLETILVRLLQRRLMIGSGDHCDQHVIICSVATAYVSE